jgi:hypothetical protein
MNDIATQVKATLTHEAHDVAPPPIDHAAFDQAVRGVRWRRRVTVSGAVGMAAACAVIAGYGFFGGSSTGADDQLMPATNAPGAHTVKHPAFVLAGDGYLAGVSDNDDWGAASMSLAGVEESFRTSSGVLLVGRDSRLYEAEIEVGHGFTFSDDEPLTDAAVQSVVVARDGMSAAWITLDDHLVVWDLVEDKQIRRSDVSPQAHLYAIAADGVLLEDPGHQGWDGRLRLETGGPTYPMGTMKAGPVDSADLTHNMMALTSGSRTAFEGRGESGAPAARAVSVDAGAGQLGPDGAYYLGLTMQESVDGTAPAIAVWSTSTGERSDFTGLPRFTDRAAWLDDETVAVSGAGPLAGDVYVCSVRSMECGLSVSDNPEDSAGAPASLDLPSSFIAAF